ncbi:MAG: hypothetical protein ACO32I_06465 [Candidatus Limnocylindrus sp.]|jgi:hypothetical protein
MNETEQRQLIRQLGMARPYRGELPTELDQVNIPSDLQPSAQTVLRNKTEAFVQAHWDILRETLTCTGNCGQIDNTCTDAKALTCYKVNQRAIDAT